MSGQGKTDTTLQSVPGKPFVMLSNGRSGTNFLVSLLLSTKQVLFGWEPFNTSFKGYSGGKNFSVPKPVLDRMNDTSFRDTDPEGYISYCAGFTGALNDTGVKMTGFKIFPPHNEDVYWKMTRDARFRALVLERRSTLSVYSSLRIVKETKEWISRDNGSAEAQSEESPAPAKEQVKVKFHPKGFENFSAMYRERFIRTLDNLKNAHVEYLHIYYEDLVSDPKTIASILDFLGIDAPAAEETWIKKQNDPNVLNRFTNPEAALPFLEQEQREAAAVNKVV